MSRLLCAILAVLMILPVLASAKTVLYVTASPSCWHGPCSCLSDEEKLFCERIGSLGYNVTITSEGHVLSNSPQWQSDWNNAGMIFLGDISSNVSNSSSQQGQQFCDVGLWNAVSQDRKIFATFGAARKSGDLVGCALRGNTMIVGAPDSNDCVATMVAVTQNGYITTGWPVDSTFLAYSSATSMVVNDNNDWVAVSCTIGGVTKLWSVLSTKSKGTFWGLDKPSMFTNDTWTLFDRAVIYTMGDNVWTINAFTVPELPTAGQPVWVAAHVFDRGKEVSTGNVSQLLNGRLAGKLEWDGSVGAWLNRSLVLSSGTTLAVGGDQSTVTLPVKAGNLSVNILSGNYQAGKYNLQADVKSGLSTISADVRYRIRAANLSILAEGTINMVNGVYQTDVALGDSGDLVVEVNARTATDTGGSVKTIRSAQLLRRGTDWTLDPSELQLSSTKPGRETVKFTIGSITSRITDLKVSSRGELAGSTFIQSVPSSLNAGESMSFNVTIDWTGMVKREYTGSILFESDQFSEEIPIKLFYLDVPGNWITIQPGTWSATVAVGMRSSKVFSISNKAPYVTSAVSIRPSAELGGMITVKSKPVWVLPGGSADFELVFDAAGAGEGTEEGTVTVSSSLGSAELPVTIIVTTDLMPVKLQLVSSLSAARIRLYEMTWADTTALEAKAAAVNSSLARFDAAWNSGDWSAASSALSDAQSLMSELQAGIDRMGPPIPWDVILIVVGIAGLGVVAFFGFRWWKKRHKKVEAEEEEQEEELPKAEDRYRTEWY